ncbi:hypothetical protein X797_008023 [Metarhizium robertsii]|uniref:Uncharacterized protein n=1 Tax=Metarhizium robertsii TaxID=568076 RepID=A0A014NBR2_9HYPO|nr:hypothetical protein X797_008023 [Metarhizium robertsii]
MRSRSTGDRDANQNRTSIQIDKGGRLGKKFNRFDEKRTKLSLAASVLGPSGGLEVFDHMAQPRRYLCLEVRKDEFRCNFIFQRYHTDPSTILSPMILYNGLPMLFTSNGWLPRAGCSAAEADELDPFAKSHQDTRM